MKYPMKYPIDIAWSIISLLFHDPVGDLRPSFYLQIKLHFRDFPIYYPPI